MTIHFYFNRYTKKHKTLGAQLQQSIDDDIRVYPEPPELGEDELQLNGINLPMPENVKSSNSLFHFLEFLRNANKTFSAKLKTRPEDMNNPEYEPSGFSFFYSTITFYFKKINLKLSSNFL